MRLSFRGFLEEYFLKVNPEVTKDDFEDSFDNWVSDMQYDDWVELGDIYGKLPTKIDVQAILDDIIDFVGETDSDVKEYVKALRDSL